MMTTTAASQVRGPRRQLRVAGAVVGGLALVAALIVPAAAYPRPGTVERVSLASDGAEGDSWSFVPAVSADARYVAFESAATNLVPSDAEDVWDILVRDRETGVTERVTQSSAGARAGGNSFNPAISADGRYVVFESVATNLVPSDTSGNRDVFVRDLQAGTTLRVSVAPDGAEANGDSRFGAISGDGRYIAFDSTASNLVPGDANGEADVFVRDSRTGTTERVSVASDGTEGNGLSTRPAISADGDHIAFRSIASNLGPGDGNGESDVYVHDRPAGTTERVSVTTGGREGNDDSRFPAISAGGRHVAFQSVASNLVPGDANGESDVFVHDRQTGTTERVSVASSGMEGNGQTRFASISADGRHVGFDSAGTNLVAQDGNDTWDSFVHDRRTGTTERVSVAADGEANGFSSFVTVAADARHVAFSSDATNIVPGDTNGASDVFMVDRGPATGIGALDVSTDAEGLVVSGWATFSGVTIAAAEDAEEDGEAVGPVSARELGAEVTAASVTYRPEQEDLLLRLQLASLPGPVVGAAPAVLYRWSFTVAGTAYEVRALRAGVTAVAPAAPHIALYVCEPSCDQIAELPGGIGATGPEVRAAVPMDLIDAGSSATLDGVQVSTALGEVTPGPLVAIDEAELPDATVTPPHVDVAITPATAGEGEATYGTRAALVDGQFSATLDSSSLPAGEYRVWARACLGSICGADSVNRTP